jgi:hypothetical protein
MLSHSVVGVFNRRVQAALMRMYCFTGGIFETHVLDQICGYYG